MIVKEGLKMDTAPEYTVQERSKRGNRRCNDLVHLSPLRIPLMNLPSVYPKLELLHLVLLNQYLAHMFPEGP